MMTSAVTVKVHNGHRRRVRLWIPLLPILVVLSPVALLVVIVLAVACLANRVNPIRFMRAGWEFLRSLRGTRIEFEQGRTAVQVRLT